MASIPCKLSSASLFSQPTALPVADIVVDSNPWVYGIELLGSLSGRSFKWVKLHSGAYHLEKQKSLSSHLLLTLRIVQLIIFPLALLCLALKAFVRQGHLLDGVYSKEGPGLVQGSNSAKLKHAIIVIGAIASGKNYFRTMIQANSKNEYISIDADNIKERVMPSYSYAIKDSPKGIDFEKMGEKAVPKPISAKLQYESCYIRNKHFLHTIQAGQNLIFDGTGADVIYYSTFVCALLKHYNYRIELIFVETSLPKCQERAILRAKISGRNVPPDLVAKSWNAAKKGFEALKKFADAWVYYNNDGEKPVIWESSLQEPSKALPQE